MLRKTREKNPQKGGNEMGGKKRKKEHSLKALRDRSCRISVIFPTTPSLKVPTNLTNDPSYYTDYHNSHMTSPFPRKDTDRYSADLLGKRPRFGIFDVAGKKRTGRMVSQGPAPPPKGAPHDRSEKEKEQGGSSRRRSPTG